MGHQCSQLSPEETRITNHTQSSPPQKRCVPVFHPESRQQMLLIAWPHPNFPASLFQNLLPQTFSFSFVSQSKGPILKGDITCTLQLLPSTLSQSESTPDPGPFSYKTHLQSKDHRYFAKKVFFKKNNFVLCALM